MNTHAPNPFAGEGLYDWLRHREPRWARLAIIHRLDKETAGVMVFGKTLVANQSLTKQFTRREVRKTYLLLTDRKVTRKEFTVLTAITRLGEKYVCRPWRDGADRAETHFRVLQTFRYRTLLEAEPVTGRTHQIRLHAAEQGFPVLGDQLYGGTPAARLYLHSATLSFKHPVSGAELTFRVKPDFPLNEELEEKQLCAEGHFARSLNLRARLIDAAETNACRLIHGAADDWPGWYVDLLGDYLLSQAGQPLSREQIQLLPKAFHPVAHGVYHKILKRNMCRATVEEVSAQHVFGETAPDRFLIRENGLVFELSCAEGCSVGLFLDQRDNRRRFLVNHVGADFPLWYSSPANAEVLNTFAYTCGFSVCAAKAGARTSSIDLSKKYLEWGQRNFALNDLETSRHDFIHGDVLGWLRRLARKRRRFDVVVLDPPTFSQSKETGVFRAEKDYGLLVRAVLPLLKANGVLFASTNAADWKPEDFLNVVETSIRSANRSILRRHYVPQPPDFPISRAEPAYLKTVWMRISS